MIDSPAAPATMASPGQGPEELLAAVAGQIAVSQAARLARLGRYAEAEDLLAGLVAGDRKRASALDLMARIRAQQGRYDEAEGLWLEAARLDPSQEAFRAGLTRLAELRERPSRRPFVLVPLAVVCVVLAVIVLGVFATRVTQELRAVRLALDEGAATLSAVEQAVTGELQAGATDAAPRSAQESGGFDRERALAELEAGLQIRGVTLRRENDALQATFEVGLFGEATTLVPEAAALLGELGRRLEPFADRIRIEVTGHTDDLLIRDRSRYRDNLALGLARAVRAVDYLRGATDLPARVFVARTGGESQPPFSNETAADRRRNRTVTLRISLVE